MQFYFIVQFFSFVLKFWKIVIDVIFLNCKCFICEIVEYNFTIEAFILKTLAQKKKKQILRRDKNQYGVVCTPTIFKILMCLHVIDSSIAGQSFIF